MRNGKFSMKKQLVLMFVGTTLLIYFSLAVVLQYAIDRHFYAQDYSHLLSKYNAITKSDLQNPQTLLSAIANSPAYLWLVKDGKIIDQNSTITFPSKQLIRANLQGVNSKKAIEWSEKSLRIRAFSFPINNSYLLVIGISINHHYKLLSELRLILFWSMGLALIASAAYSIIIVNKGLRPISTLNQHIRKIAPNRLGIRVPLDDLPSELQILAATHNKMLDRLESGFDRLSEFSSDIAHELRTPLSNISTQNQVILSMPRSKEEYQETIASNLEELNRIIKTINDVLYIAKAENSLIHRNDEWLSVRGEVDRIVDYFSILGDEHDLMIETSGQAELCIDKNMFERALNNLLSNAIRHAQIGSTIKVDIASQANQVSVTVSNLGEPIPSEAILHLFDRFYRADKSRQYTGSVGAGLGLSITQSIVHAYQGEIHVQFEQGYTSFIMVFPTTSV